jgi:hypothetical protein
MRTPPPVLPPGKESSPDYRSTWFDRAGPDAGLRLRAGAYGGMVAAITFVALFLVAAQSGHLSVGSLMEAFVIAAILGGATFLIGAKLGDGAGAVAKSFTMPSGNSTPYAQTFSYQEALAAKGDVAGALESYEAVIAEQPTATAPRLQAAEHYARGNRNPQRAAGLFREVREMPGVSSRDALYASSRLVDLYDGPLDEPGRALVELRRIIEQYPDSKFATHARAALPTLKGRLADERGK